MHRKTQRDCCLAAGFALPAGAGLAGRLTRRPISRLRAFGGDCPADGDRSTPSSASTRSIPNVKVDDRDRPDLQRLGRLRHASVLSQFNANNAYDVYGTAIETFRTFEARNLFIPLDDYIAKTPSYSDFDPALFKYSVLSRARRISSRSAGTTS